MNTGQKRLSSGEKEGQYRDIFDTAADGVIIADLKTGRVVDANPAARNARPHPRRFHRAAPGGLH